MQRVFLDSDVVISSLISDNGASSMLMHKKSVAKFISSLSYKEIMIVVDRLNLNKVSLQSILKENVYVTKLKIDNKKAKNKFKKYVNDLEDSHIVAGAVGSKANFILTFNLKHFNINEIKEKFKINILTPGNFLQYLRSIK